MGSVQLMCRRNFFIPCDFLSTHSKKYSFVSNDNVGARLKIEWWVLKFLMNRRKTRRECWSNRLITRFLLISFVLISFFTYFQEISFIPNASKQFFLHSKTSANDDDRWRWFMVMDIRFLSFISHTQSASFNRVP